MDKDKLKEFIKEVAEIKELKPVTSGERPADGETEVLYKGEWITLDKRVNPTLGFKFVKLKYIFRSIEITQYDGTACHVFSSYCYQFSVVLTVQKSVAKRVLVR